MGLCALWGPALAAMWGAESSERGQGGSEPAADRRGRGQREETQQPSLGSSIKHGLVLALSRPIFLMRTQAQRKDG